MLHKDHSLRLARQCFTDCMIYVSPTCTLSLPSAVMREIVAKKLGFQRAGPPVVKASKKTGSSTSSAASPTAGGGSDEAQQQVRSRL